MPDMIYCRTEGGASYGLLPNGTTQTGGDAPAFVLIRPLRGPVKKKLLSVSRSGIRRSAMLPRTLGYQKIETTSR